MDKHSQWIKPSTHTVTLFEELTAEPTVTHAKLFGSPTASVNGNMYAWIHQDKISLRLPEDVRKELIEAGMGEPVDSTGKRMREYCMVDYDIASSDKGRELTIRALAYVSKLPPKRKY